MKTSPLFAGELSHHAYKIIEAVRSGNFYADEYKSHALAEIVAAEAIRFSGPIGNEYFSRQLEKSTNPFIRTMIAKSGATSRSDIDNSTLHDLAASFVASFSGQSVLDSVLPYAVQLPQNLNKVLIATGTNADEVDEGGQKLVRKIGLDVGDLLPIKAASICAVTKEALGGPLGGQILERELKTSIVNATNKLFLQSLIDSDTPRAANLSDAILLASDSATYVVALSTQKLISLQLAEPSISSIQNLIFVPISTETLAALGLEMAIIPASRLVIRSWPLEVQTSGHTDLNMSDSLDAESEVVSMFQSNSVAILAERMFLIGGDTSGVVIVEAEGS